MFQRQRFDKLKTQRLLFVVTAAFLLILYLKRDEEREKYIYINVIKIVYLLFHKAKISSLKNMRSRSRNYVFKSREHTKKINYIT